MKILRPRPILLAAMALALALGTLFLTRATSGQDAPPADAPNPTAGAHQSGGEADGIVQVANLIYAGSKTSKCFSNHFLERAEADSTITTNHDFRVVKLSSDELFEYPLVIMTGEGAFSLPDEERRNLRRFIERGGFLLASASCSSPDWDHSFRAEMARIFPDHTLKALTLTHPVFHTIYDINELTAKHGTPQPLEGLSFDDRLGVLYSQEGLNDTEHTQGCCCCGGNEITNCEQVNVNILAYCLLY